MALVTLAVLLLGLVVVRVTGAEHRTLLVLLVGALPVVLLPAYPLLGAAVWLRSRRLVAVSAVLVAAHVLVVAPTLRAAPLPDGAADAPRLRVVVANLYVRNPEPRRAAQTLRGLDADLLVVAELDARGLAGLHRAGLSDDLPHSVVEQDAGAETVGLFSRLPLRDVVLRRTGGRTLPRATVEVGGTPVRILTAHPLPPVPALEQVWRSSLVDLAGEVAGLDQPAIVAGDLNADRDHAVFRRLLATGLRDAHDERGRGLARTWPAAFPLLHLDHVLVRDAAAAELAVLAVREVRVPGSDHRAVVADLAVLAR